MNNNHSSKETAYRPRIVADSVSKAAKESPVIVLTGARQTGKSTLLNKDPHFSGWKYFSFDDLSLVAQANSDPSSIWEGFDRVILDEVQRVPAILSAIKRTVDKDRHLKKFILSGSANLLLMSRVTESLAGRALYFPLYPMTLAEIRETEMTDILKDLLDNVPLKPKVIKAPKENLFKLMSRGFMPPLLHISLPENVTRWWEGYIMTYLERDLRQLSQVESLVDFRNLMQAVALRSGQVINQTEIARDIKIGQATVYRYLNLLEATCLLVRIPAYSKSRTKRLIKSPKIYFLDPGLTSYLCGYYDENSLKTAREAGSIFETFVLLHLSVLCELMVPKARIYYWRTVTGKEVDFVVEYGNKLLAIEVKLSSGISYGDSDNLRTFLAEHPKDCIGIIIYTGNEVRYLADKIVCLPISMLY
ncbi:MAG: ATP-binding protein [Elusimicrobiota bacterium]